MYPLIRLRRNRKTEWLRDLISETHLSTKDLILPIFVVEGINQLQEIPLLPGVLKLSIDQVLITAKKAVELGIKAIALFPCISQEKKNENADEAYNSKNLICKTINSIKKANINLGIICDVALDPYTTHGHDGIVINDDVDNDKTIVALCKQALVLAEAGADIIAPSDMMDGRIVSIRNELDKQGFSHVNILSYSVKYASNFYYPFRSAVNSNNVRLDKYIKKSTYQMDIRNSREALREIENDLKEGADMIMIKPGMPFLDVIYMASSTFNITVLAYQVSGEYAMLKQASIAGLINWEESMLECLIAIKRAGAKSIFTYAALEIAKILND